MMMMILLMVVIMMRNSSDDDDFADYLTIPRVVPLEVQNGKLAFKCIMMMTRMRMVIGGWRFCKWFLTMQCFRQA